MDTITVLARSLASEQENTLASIELDNAFAQHFEMTSEAALRITTTSIILHTSDLLKLTGLSTHAVFSCMASTFDSTRARKTIQRKAHISKYGLVENGFGNSISFEFKHDERNVITSCKIFANGKVQCSGISRFTDVPMVAKVVSVVLNTLLGRDDICVKSFTLSFINAAAKFPFGINTQILYERLFPTLMGRVQMSPRIHKRLTISYTDTSSASEKTKALCSIMLFHTGSIIITGCKSLAVLASSYQYILRLLDDAFPYVGLPAPPVKEARLPLKRGRKRKTDTFESFLKELM